jgi:hypothetical protein
MPVFWYDHYDEFSDHSPPHFHVRCGEMKAVIAILNLTLLAGYLSPRAFGLVMEWAALHQLVEFTGVFAPLEDRQFFLKVGVNPELGTNCWPNDVDIDPDVLYSRITGEPLPDFELDYVSFQTKHNSLNVD